jgi:uncharacterized protein (DUF1697 family)
MTRYVALLRGIGPMNPNMRNEKLRDVFDRLGFDHVETVISSGNVLFESPSHDVPKLEAKIEKALPAQLGFRSATILRSQERLQRLVERDPFRGREDSPKSRLNVTFLKYRATTKLKFPVRADDGSYELLGLFDQAICSTIDTTETATPDLMGWLDKTFGKEITTRTWKTVGRILRRMGGEL